MPKAKPTTVSNITEFKQTNSEITKNKYNVGDLIPFEPTEKQQQFVKAFDKGIRIISQTGSTGTGKTYSAIYAALKAVFEQSEYQRVVIIRSAVETRSIGFLPGSDAEKMSAYERPYRDTVEEILNCKEKGHYDNLKSKGYIEYMGTSFVRGISLPNSIIIIDEIQNQDMEELWSCMTRLSKNSRVILCGDIKQDDLKRKREKSGFGEIMEIMKIMAEMFNDTDVPTLPDFRNIEYTSADITRDELVKRLIMAREEYEERQKQKVLISESDTDS